MSEKFDEDKFKQDYAKDQKIKSISLKAILLFFNKFDFACPFVYAW